MKKIVELRKDKDRFKKGDFLRFDIMLPVLSEVNIVKPHEPAKKLRVFQVVHRRGFDHRLVPFDGRNRTMGLKKGMKFFYISK